MKTKAIVVLSMILFMFSCTSSVEKETKTDPEGSSELTQTEDNENLDEDMETYKKIAAERIAENEKSVADLKLRIAIQKEEARAEYENKINELNNKNTDLKKRISDFKTDKSSNWELFKNEFSHDMDELGTAFKDFTVKNEK